MTITGIMLSDPTYNNIVCGVDYVEFNIRGCYDSKIYTVRFRSRYGRKGLKAVMDDPNYCVGLELIVRGDLHIQVNYQNGRKRSRRILYAWQLEYSL